MIKTTKTEVPDKTIGMSHGDEVRIYIRKRDVLFSFSCDGTGNCFAIPKKELIEMCEKRKRRLK